MELEECKRMWSRKTLDTGVGTPEWMVVSPYELRTQEEGAFLGMSTSTLASRFAVPVRAPEDSSRLLQCWESSNGTAAKLGAGGGTVGTRSVFAHG